MSLNNLERGVKICDAGQRPKLYEGPFPMMRSSLLCRPCDTEESDDVINDHMLSVLNN